MNPSRWLVVCNEMHIFFSPSSTIGRGTAQTFVTLPVPLVVEIDDIVMKRASG
jgi:hypothetical protein